MCLRRFDVLVATAVGLFIDIGSLASVGFDGLMVPLILELWAAGGPFYIALAFFLFNTLFLSTTRSLPPLQLHHYHLYNTYFHISQHFVLTGQVTGIYFNTSEFSMLYSLFHLPRPSGGLFFIFFAVFFFFDVVSDLEGQELRASVGHSLMIQAGRIKGKSTGRGLRASVLLLGWVQG